MMYYAAIFLLIAIAAFIIGFLGNLIVGGVAFVAKICFFVFLGLFIVTLAIDLMKKRRHKK